MHAGTHLARGMCSCQQAPGYVLGWFPSPEGGLAVPTGHRASRKAARAHSQRAPQPAQPGGLAAAFMPEHKEVSEGRVMHRLADTAAWQAAQRLTGARTSATPMARAEKVFPGPSFGNFQKFERRDQPNAGVRERAHGSQQTDPGTLVTTTRHAASSMQAAGPCSPRQARDLGHLRPSQEEANSPELGTQLQTHLSGRARSRCFYFY